jgi:hypothetical protein
VKRVGDLFDHYGTNVESEVAQMVVPSYPKAVRAAVERRATADATQTALAVERFRLAHNGEVPESLAAVTPQYLSAVPRDVDGKPLRFKKLARGYVIYSIGADGVDNGGKERASNTATNGYDITFTVER